MFDAVTYGAAVGAAKKYTDEHSGGSSDAVKYTEQSLTSEQQAQARENIGAAASTDIPTDAVKYTAQTLTDAQKTQARTNIGAVGGDDDNKLRLGQMVTNDGKYGLGNIFNSTQLTSITFQTTDVPISGFSADTVIGIFGNFLLFYQSGIKFAPITGYTGISKTGQWVHAENCFCMFGYCVGSLTSLDISMLDTSEVKNMARMFYSCTKLTYLDLSTFDTSKVQDMSYMFSYCAALTALDILSFNTSAVKNMERMFISCTALTSLDISSFDMTNVIEYTDMFTNDTALTTLKTPKINPHDDIPLPRTLYSQDGTAYTNLPVTTGTSIELRASWT